MKQNLPTRRMREQPDLEQLKRQAKELLRDYSGGDSNAIAEVNSHYDKADPSLFALHDAQLVLARSYGFESWTKLKSYVDGVTIQRLVEAIQVGATAVVESMLRPRPELANMSLSYGNEHRPLHFAVMNRSAELTRLLMSYGADAHAGIHPHRRATTARTLAEERGFDEIVAIIDEEEAKRLPPHESDDVGQSETAESVIDKEAREAVAAGDLEWVRKRHAAGSLTNYIRWDGGGLLTLAVRSNQPEMLKLLLDCGLDPDERTSEGSGDWIAYTQAIPLWNAAAEGKEEMAELLLAHGANPNAHVDSSGSPVYSAFSHKQWDMVRLLCAHGGIVSADTAALYRQTDLAREMFADDAKGVLKAGVVSAGEPLAYELLQFGACGGATEIVRMALEHIDWPRDDARWFRCLTEPITFWHHIPWLYAGDKKLSRTGYLECFKLILNRCDPNIVAGFGRTALHEVAAMGDWVTDSEAAQFASALIEAGATGTHRDEILRSTPLGWACRWGRASVVKVLLEAGLDPEERAAEAWATPIAWATKMGHEEIIALLTQRHDGAT